MGSRKPRNRILAAVMSFVLAFGLMPLPAYASQADNAPVGGGSELVALAVDALQAQSDDAGLIAQEADEYVYVPSSDYDSAASSNAGSPGTSAYGNTGSWENGFMETIYLSSEIGTSPRDISSIAYYITGDYTAANKKWENASIRVYLAETDLSGIASYNDLIDSSNATLVYEGSMTLGGIVSAWQELEFNKGSFAYSGKKNLAVIFMASGGTRSGAAIMTANQNTSGKGWSFYDDKNADSFTDYATLRAKIQEIGSTANNSSYKSAQCTYRPSIRFGYTESEASGGGSGDDSGTVTGMSFTEQVADGTYGTSEKPYEIYSEADLVELQKAVNGSSASYAGKYFELANDIELSSAWTPIGNNASSGTSCYFDGFFNGKGHTVSNVSISSKVAQSGFFGCVKCASSNASIRNLKLVGAHVAQGTTSVDIAGDTSSTSKYAGALVGYVTGSTGYSFSISNCITNVNVSGLRGVGGLVGNGSAYLASITDCLILGDVSGVDQGTNNAAYVAGVLGNGSYDMSSGAISRVLFTGQVTPSANPATTGAFANTINALVGKIGGSNSTDAKVADYMASCYYLAQGNESVKSYRRGGSTVVDAVNETNWILPLATAGNFSTAQDNMGSSFWNVSGTSIAPLPFAASEGYVVASAPEPTTYGITKADATNGTFTVKVGDVEATEAAEGNVVTIAATPDENYEIDTVTVAATDGSTDTVEVTGTRNTRSFTMPAKAVTVTVTFKTASTSIDAPAAVTGLTYSGSAQTVVTAGNGYTLSFAGDAPSDATIDSSGNATLTNATAADVSVTATLAPGYTWSDNTTTAKTITVSMGKGTNPGVTVDPASVSLLNTKTARKTATVTYAGTGELGVESDNASVATASISENVVTIVPAGVGTATVTVAAAAGSNYTAASTATVNVTVSDASALTVQVVPMTKDSVLEAGEQYIIASRSASDGAVMGVAGTTSSVRNVTIDESKGVVVFASVADKEESVWTAEASGDNFRFKTSGGKYLKVVATGISIDDSGTDLIWKSSGNGSSDYSTIQTSAALYSSMYGYVQYSNGFKHQLAAQPSTASAKVWKVASTTPATTQYDVTFVDEDGTTELKSAAKYDEGTTGSAIDKPTDPTKAATAQYTYTFDGWYDANDVKLTDSYEVTGDTVFKAKYAETTNQYTVTFVDEDNATVLKVAQAYDYGTVWAGVAKPENPTKADADGYSYTFKEWVGAPESVTADVTVTASYDKTPIEYAIAYELGGGTNAAANPAKYTVESDDITLAEPTRDGYTFEGWSGTDVTDTSKDVTIPKGSTGARSFTAHWTENASEDVKTDKGVEASGGVFDEELEGVTKLELQVENKTADSATKEAAVKNAVKEANEASDGVIADTDTVAAVFEVDLVKHMADGSAENMATGVGGLRLTFPVAGVKADDKVKVVQLHKATQESTPKVITYEGDRVTVDDDKVSITLSDELSQFIIAVQDDDTQEAESYTVTFDSNGGSEVAEQVVESGAQASQPTAPTREGYTFGEWQLDGKAYDFSTAVTEDITLKATWNKAESGNDNTGDDNTGDDNTGGNTDTGDKDDTTKGDTTKDDAKDTSKDESGNTDTNKDDTAKDNAGGSGGKSASTDDAGSKSGSDADAKTGANAGANAGADANDQKAAEPQKMFRLYNPFSGEHHYTAKADERDDLINAGWEDEGEGWTAPAESDMPVYRLYNSHEPLGDHHYTTSKAEYDELVAAGWTGEGVGWYSADDDGAALYRVYNPNAYATGMSGAHHYTADKEEADGLAAIGWQAEGIAWYGVK